MKKKFFIVTLLMAIVLCLLSCSNTEHNEDRPIPPSTTNPPSEPVNNDAANASGEKSDATQDDFPFSFGGMSFSIPGYYKIHTEDENVFWVEDTDTATVSLTFLDSLTASPAKFSTSIDSLIDHLASGEALANPTPVDVQDFSTAEIYGKIASVSGNLIVDDAENPPASCTVAYLFNSHRSNAILIMFVETNHPEKDYYPDFYKILESATCERTSGKVANAGDLGDYYVEIKNYTLTKDYDGKPAIIITYGWTNNSDETTSAAVSVSGQAFQDGIELDTAFITSDNYDGSSALKDVRPGTTLDIQCAFVLSNQSSPVEFELTEWISFSSEDIVYTDFIFNN